MSLSSSVDCDDSFDDEVAEIRRAMVIYMITYDTISYISIFYKIIIL